MEEAVYYPKEFRVFPERYEGIRVIGADVGFRKVNLKVMVR